MKKLKPCLKCGENKLKLWDCGYSSFNVGGVKCECVYKKEWNTLSCFPEEDIIKLYNTFYQKEKSKPIVTTLEWYTPEKKMPKPQHYIPHKIADVLFFTDCLCSGIFDFEDAVWEDKSGDIYANKEIKLWAYAPTKEELEKLQIIVPDLQHRKTV